MKHFPVLCPDGASQKLRDLGEAPISVPWSLLAPHEEQAHKNHGQTLHRLAERGGLTFCEMVAIIENVHWRETFKLSAIDALKRLKKHLAEHEQSTASPMEADANGSFLLSKYACGAGITDRNDEHRPSECLLIVGHPESHYDPRTETSWTDADHYPGSPGRSHQFEEE